ncbi:MAG: hypothetical protein KAH18_08025 [Psychromonas sp.]|nr:hypothetical protein [Psychromonas sp.]
MKQPIEALFAWFMKVTSIGDALNVSSSIELLTPIYERLSVAMMLISYPELGF